jgi:8-oxo-dGTP pyrophosphatase MutT (NUDIX family)
VLVFDSKDRLLLLKRADNHCWGPPGGAVEPGEVVEEAAARETQEETGLQLSGLSLLGLFSGERQFYRYPNGDEVHNVMVVYECRSFSEQVQLSNEHTDWGWFAPDEIPEPVSPPIIPVLETYIPAFHHGGA